MQDNAKNSITQDKEKKAATPVETFYEWMGAAVVALVAVAILFSLFFRVVNVSGTSMANTLQEGEKLLLAGVLNNPSFGDIVVIKRDYEEPLIKRVIGLPGDTIRIDGTQGKVIRNGEALDEPYTRDGFTPHCASLAGVVTVPEGCIFVLGDNRWNSKDSRSPEVGMVSLEDVVGTVTYRLAPFQSLRNGE